MKRFPWGYFHKRPDKDPRPVGFQCKPCLVTRKRFLRELSIDEVERNLLTDEAFKSEFRAPPKLTKSII